MKYPFYLMPLLLMGASETALAQANQANTGGLDEVVVTAERRETTVQKSSLSLQVLSAQDVESVRRPSDLNTLVPGIQIGSTGPNPQVYVRGVGDAARNSRAQSGIMFSVDGVALARPSAATTNFFDLARVEVLKGPQGTLYGRNSSGGAVNLISVSPRLKEFGGYIGLEVGSFDLRSGEAALNVPIGETAALRVSGKAVTRDGYLSDGSQDQQTTAGRARLLWEPSPQFSALINLDKSHIGGQGSGVTVLPEFNNDPWFANTGTPLPYAFQFGAATAPYTAPNDRQIDADLFGVSAEIKADLGFATLTFIPAYRTQDQAVVSYNSNFRFGEFIDDRTASAELRLARDGDALDWIVGGFYYKDENDVEIYPTQGNFNSAQQFTDEVESSAVFANLIYSPVEPLRLIAGARYTEETTSGTFVNGVGSEPEVRFVPASSARRSFSPASMARTTWKAGAEYDLSAGSMIYATAATGFKGGGTNPTPCGGPNFDPEIVDQYLLGSRNRFFGNTLQVNAEAFLLNAQGQQVSAITQVCNAAGAPGASGFLTFNVGESTIKGANIDLLWRPTQADKVHFFVEYLDAIADEFVFRQLGVGAYAPALRSSCSSLAGAGGFFTINCSGQRLPRSPEWVAQIDYEHVFALGNGADITPRLSAQYAAERLLDIGYGPNGVAPEYTVVNADLTYTAPKGWSISGFVTNLTDETVYTSGTSIAPLAPNGVRYYTANIEPPRMFGLRVRADF